MTRLERRWRAAIAHAMIPTETAGLPAWPMEAAAAFWDRFDATAPLHVQLGMRAAVLTLAAMAPALLGRAATLDRLSPDELERLLVAACTLPGASMVLDVFKVVACLGYFDGPAAQAHFRDRRTS